MCPYATACARCLSRNPKPKQSRSRILALALIVALGLAPALTLAPTLTPPTLTRTNPNLLYAAARCRALHSLTLTLKPTLNQVTGLGARPRLA